jgi:hypothetical protein
VILAAEGAQLYLDLLGLLIDRRAEVVALVATGPDAKFDTPFPWGSYLTAGRAVRVVFDPTNAAQTAASERWLESLEAFDVTASRHPVPSGETMATLFRGPQTEAGRDLVATLLKR